MFYLIPGLPDAVDPGGKVFKLPWAGKMAIGLFLMAGVWWVFEVMPIGVTAIAIGLFQVLFYIRTPKEALGDFLDPSVWFIFGSVVIGTAFSASGLTKRMAYKMLTIVGEKTNLILLGTFLVVGAMTLIMAHTAVAAAIFPLLLAINALYSESDQPTRFGKGLFIGMAWAAGAGSIITFLGAARGVAAAGMFKQFTGQDIGFFELILLHAAPGPLDGLRHLAHHHHLFQTGAGGHRGAEGKRPGLDQRTGTHEQQGKIRPGHGDPHCGIVHAQGVSADEGLHGHGPGRHHAGGHVALLPHPHPHRGGPGDHPLEHHPPVRRRHVHRLLPLEHQGGGMAGGALAVLLPQRPLAGVRPGHRLLRPGA